jgi:hypothetical protein
MTYFNREKFYLSEGTFFLFISPKTGLILKSLKRKEAGFLKMTLDHANPNFCEALSIFENHCILPIPIPSQVRVIPSFPQA